MLEDAIMRDAVSERSNGGVIPVSQDADMLRAKLRKEVSGPKDTRLAGPGVVWVAVQAMH